MAIFYRGRHVRPKPLVISAVITLLAVFAAFMTWMAAYGVPANASESYGGRALDWAEANATGHWYLWGGTGPSYDCSGLVMEAYGHADGIWLPHNTGAMLSSGHLVRTYSPQRGDLAFFGTGHVELVTIWYHMTFGAHHTGTRIGWIGYNPAWGWAPTAFYRVVR